MKKKKPKHTYTYKCKKCQEVFDFIHIPWVPGAVFKVDKDLEQMTIDDFYNLGMAKCPKCGGFDNEQLFLVDTKMKI